MSKSAELRDKSENDLHLRHRDLTDQLFKLRFQRSTGALENPSKMRLVRREIARINTILGERSKA